MISDLNMPKLDGAGLSAVLHRMRPEVKIMAITGLGSREPLTAAEGRGFDARLQKPFTAVALLAAVYRVLRSNLQSRAPFAPSEPPSPFR